MRLAISTGAFQICSDTIETGLRTILGAPMMNPFGKLV